MLKIRLRAPAKCNLHLEILGRASNGFHRLETFFQSLACHDQVYLELHTGAATSLASRGAELPSGPANLAWRAAEAWRQHDPGLPGCRITIDKRLPLAGGLGGGSSDAAAVLRGLALLRPDQVPPAVQQYLAAQLGADVAFFLHGGSAYASGFGELVEPLPDLPSRDLWLGCLDFGCPTPAVYAALSEDERGPRQALGPAEVLNRVTAGRYHNRLCEAAAQVQPRLAALFTALQAAGANWLLAGSGASLLCFDAMPPVLPADSGLRWQATSFCLRSDALACE